jgi:hypothetical protein
LALYNTNNVSKLISQRFDASMRSVAQPYPSSGPQPYPSSGPQPYPSSGPQPYPGSGPQPYPGSGPQPYPSAGPQPYPGSGQQPYPSAGTQPYPNAPAMSAPFNLTERLGFLNREAGAANAAHNFDVAIQKLEQARNLSPNDQIITRNLGLAYSNAAVMAERSGNCLKAARCYQSAAEVLKTSSNQDDYVNVLSNYQAMLQRQTLQARTN